VPEYDFEVTQLLRGEEQILRANRHWVALATTLALPAALALLVIIVDLGVGALGLETKLAVSLLILFVGGFWILWAWANWSADSITLTDQRLILERGVLRRQSKVIALDRVQDVSTSLSLAGRLLGYGRVAIAAAGSDGTEALEQVAGPLQLRDQIFIQARAQRSQIGAGGPVARAAEGP